MFNREVGLLAAAQAGVKRRYAMLAGLGFAFVEDGRRSPKRAAARAVQLLLYRLNFAGTRAVIFHNADDRDELVRRGAVRRDKTVVVPGSGVPVERFVPTPPPAGPARFLFVGRLLRSKGVEELVEAAALLRAAVPGAEVHLVGGEDANPDSADAALLAAAVARGDVVLHGQVSDVRPFLERASVFVLPSYREGMPRAALEALAAGRTTIVTDVPGCREVVRPGRHGTLVPPRSVEALAAAMIAYARDPERVARATETGRTLGFYRLVVDEENDRILGATLVSPTAAELIHILTVLIESGATWQSLAECVFIHPTWAEGLTSLARQLEREPAGVRSR